MPASDRSIDALTFVTDHFRDILRRRLSELAGLALVTLALLGAIALATWSVQDPSLSHATQKPIHNLLGFPGAIFSDLAMQLLGLAAVLLLAPLALYGWRLLSHRPLGERWRGLTFIVAIFVTAAFVSTLPRIGTWPLPTGLGGVCGDALLMLPALFIPLSGFSLLIVSLISGVAAASRSLWRSACAGRKLAPPQPMRWTTRTKLKRMTRENPKSPTAPRPGSACWSTRF